MGTKVEIMLGRGWNTKWHIFQGNPKKLHSVCGQMNNPEIISEKFGPGAAMCELCLYHHDYEDPYVRKIRNWYSAPVRARPSLPLERDQ